MLHHRRAHIDLVKRIGDQHQRRLAVERRRHAQIARHIEGLLGAGDRYQVGVNVDKTFRQMKTPGQPVRDGLAQIGRAADGRILSPLAGMGGDGFGDHCRRRVLRFAQGHHKRRHAFRVVQRIEQRPQPVERIIRQIFNGRIVHARSARLLLPSDEMTPRPCPERGAFPKAAEFSPRGS